MCREFVRLNQGCRPLQRLASRPEPAWESGRRRAEEDRQDRNGAGPGPAPFSEHTQEQRRRLPLSSALD